MYLNSLTKSVIKHDFFYRYPYTKVKNFPKMLSITLKLNIKNVSYKDLTAILLALEIISVKKGVVVKKKNLKTFLRLKKGYTTYFIVTIKKDSLNNFLKKLVNKELILSQTDFSASKSGQSFTLTSIFNNKDLKSNYNYFKHIPQVYLTVKANTKTSSEFLFLLKSYKIKQL